MPRLSHQAPAEPCNRIRNTTELMTRVPQLGLIAAMDAGGMPAAIMREEAQGQRELINSTTLPTDGLKGATPLLQAWGFTIGKQVSNDPMFIEANMPKGWARRATDHAMHSEILDPAGRVRISIFYKAAFYDRSAHFHTSRRFGYEVMGGPGYGYVQGEQSPSESPRKYFVITDGGTVVSVHGPFKANLKLKSYERDEATTALAKAEINAIHARLDCVIKPWVKAGFGWEGGDFDDAKAWSLAGDKIEGGMTKREVKAKIAELDQAFLAKSGRAVEVERIEA